MAAREHCVEYQVMREMGGKGNPSTDIEVKQLLRNINRMIEGKPPEPEKRNAPQSHEFEDFREPAIKPRNKAAKKKPLPQLKRPSDLLRFIKSGKLEQISALTTLEFLHEHFPDITRKHKDAMISFEKAKNE